MPIYGNKILYELEETTFESIFEEFNFNNDIIYESDGNKKSILDKIKSLFDRFIQFLKSVKIKLMQFLNKHFGLFKNKLDKLKEAENKSKNKNSEDKSDEDRKSKNRNVDTDLEYKAYNNLLDKINLYFSRKAFFEIITLENESEIDNKFIEYYKNDFDLKNIDSYDISNIKKELANQFDKKIEEVGTESKHIGGITNDNMVEYSIYLIIKDLTYYDKKLNEINKIKKENDKIINDLIRETEFEKKKAEKELQKSLEKDNWMKEEDRNEKRNEITSKINKLSRCLSHSKDYLELMILWQQQYMKIYNLAINEEWRFRREAAKIYGFADAYRGDDKTFKGTDQEKYGPGATVVE